LAGKKDSKGEASAVDRKRVESGAALGFGQLFGIALHGGALFPAR